MPYSLKRYFTCDHCKNRALVETLETCEFCEAELCPECCRRNYLKLVICPSCQDDEE